MADEATAAAAVAGGLVVAAWAVVAMEAEATEAMLEVVFREEMVMVTAREAVALVAVVAVAAARVGAE